MSDDQDGLSIHGLGLGIFFLLGGLAMTIGGWGPGAMLGFPLIVLGIILPVAQTYSAKLDQDRSNARRRPEREAGASYNIETKKYKERRNR